MMTSIDHASVESRRERSSSPKDHRTTYSNFSSPKDRYDTSSSPMKESSTAGSQRNSLRQDEIIEGGSHSETGSRTFRSHRNRNSGGFLLSKTGFESLPPVERHAPQATAMAKTAVISPKKKHMKRRSLAGIGLGSSPLAGNITTADQESLDDKAFGGDSTVDASKDTTRATEDRTTDDRLDVDSAQIVNLALNLSESRRNASRRIVPAPLSSPSAAIAETGGSLRYHLQQQRRTSRNVSPKPDRYERGLLSSSPRGGLAQKLNSPLQPPFDPHREGGYQYTFSASTLARAAKAKNAIELMAQYRRLLQFVPPLQPQSLERGPTNQLNAELGSPSNERPSPSWTESNSGSTYLEREYNPLQYIRNRKVRARNSKAIDGEQAGFGDLDKVLPWITAVAVAATSGNFDAVDILPLPIFAEDSDTRHVSPHSTLGKSDTALKIKRPRVDWMTTPADMLADIYWLERDDNKKMIEDRHGHKIFPPGLDLKRSRSRNGDESELSTNPITIEEPPEDLRNDAKLPEFKSVKPYPDGNPDVAASKTKLKLRGVRDAARIHHGHNGSGRDARHFWGSRSRSSSDSSDSDAERDRTRPSRAEDNFDRGSDIQKMRVDDAFTKDPMVNSVTNSRNVEGQPAIQSIVTESHHSKNQTENSENRKAGHSRSSSLIKSKFELLRSRSRDRTSLDAPSTDPRGSLEDLDSTAPNSPQTKPRTGYAFVPSIAMDLSSPRGRTSSRDRRPIPRISSQIRGNIHHLSQSTTEDENVVNTHTISNERGLESVDTLETRKRSSSPDKILNTRKTDESLKSPKPTDGSRKGKGDDSSGIRGFLKSVRNPVSRVGDLLWKRDSSSGHGNSSGVSTDDSDVEDTRHFDADHSSSRESSGVVRIEEGGKEKPQKVKQSYLSEMPSFSPSLERGRTLRTRGDKAVALDQVKSVSDSHPAYDTSRLPPRDKLRYQSSLNSVQHSPVPTPEIRPINRDSSTSDRDSSRNNFPHEFQKTDSRLNALLGLPGKRANFSQLPVTGLANLETSHDRRPSMEGQRHWSISDGGLCIQRYPTTKREVARIRALLLSSGIKAKEISRRAAAPNDLSSADGAVCSGIDTLKKNGISSVPRSQEHVLAARLLSDNIRHSFKLCRENTDIFCDSTIKEMISSFSSLQSRLVDNLTPMTRDAADEADEVSQGLVTSQTFGVKVISDKIDKIMRRRRRRFRWARRGGWVLVEWLLVGVMWYVWFLVVIARVFMGTCRGVLSVGRWLLFL